MDYLARGDAPFSAEFWNALDKAVIETAKRHLVCRRFLPLYGPLGAGASFVPVDASEKKEEIEGGLARISSRRAVELAMLCKDFTLLWRDLAEAEKNALAYDFSAASSAARLCTKTEDELILFGKKELGVEGLFSAKGAHKIKMSDWTTGEGAFKDVAAAIGYFHGANMLGRLALVVTPDLYIALERLTPAAGVLELERVKSLLEGRVYCAGEFGLKKAALVCAESEYMDLAVGLDLSVAYLGQSELNYPFRVMESIALRLKEPKAIVLFE